MPHPWPPPPLVVDSTVGQILKDLDNTQELPDDPDGDPDGDFLLNDALGGGVTGGVDIDPNAYRNIVDVIGVPTSAHQLKKGIRDGFRLAFAALLQNLSDGGFLSGGGGGSDAAPAIFDGTCASGDAVGDIVYITGAGGAVAKADITDASKSSHIGIITSKPTSTTCVVQTSGLIMIYSGLTPNSRYFVGADARPTLTKPTGSDLSPKMVVMLGFAVDTDIFLLRPIIMLRARS